VIARVWSARATPSGAEAYVAYFRRSVLPELARIPGHRGAMVMREARGAPAGVVRVVTFWDSLEAIAAFAGDDVAAAVVEPEASAILEDFDERVEHLELLLDTREWPQPST
jgi:heme-degrading monooxygenase HmoA